MGITIWDGEIGTNHSRLLLVSFQSNNTEIGRRDLCARCFTSFVVLKHTKHTVHHFIVNIVSSIVFRTLTVWAIITTI